MTRDTEHGWSRRGFIAGGAAAGVAAALGLDTLFDGKVTENDGLRPNFVLVNVDDMRHDLMGCENHPYLATPNLDRMSAEGIRFTRAYVTTPLCGPSRAGLMTGLLPEQHGTKLNDDAVDKTRPYPDGPFLPRLFKHAGYRNAWIGKVHMGGKHPRPEFDHWFARKGVPWPADFDHSDKEAHRKYRDSLIHTHAVYNVNGSLIDIEKYHCDVVFEEGAKFIEQSLGKPFFLYLAPYTVHAPFVPAPRHAGRYEGRGIPPRPNREWASYDEEDRRAMIFSYEKQCEMMLAVDEGVGLLMDTLLASGISGSTYVLFTSDNGFMFAEHGLRAKQHPWEESIRVPLLAWAPGRIPAGTVSRTPVSHADLLITGADLAGASVPDSCYGVSLRHVLHGREEHARETVMLQRYGEPGEDAYLTDWFAIIEDDYKLVRFTDRPGMRLFNLGEDPYEMKDLAGQEKSRVKRLARAMDAQMQENRRRFEASGNLPG